MKPLSSEEITRKLGALNGWAATPQGIAKQYVMDNFLAAMNLVNRTADLAEQAQHHPDIFISYNKVTFTLMTHDAGGITEKDFALASRIEAIAP